MQSKKSKKVEYVTRKEFSETIALITLTIGMLTDAFFGGSKAVESIMGLTNGAGVKTTKRSVKTTISRRGTKLKK